MRILFTICARGNSKGIKNKNLKKINGKPLIYHTVKNALKIKKKNQVVISSDSNKIINLSKKLKINNLILRPKNLAKDNSAKIPVIRHALLKMEKKYNHKFPIIVDLDVTAPLRNENDINGALNKFIKYNYQTLFSVNKSRKNPYYNCVEIVKDKIKPVKRKKKYFSNRQSAPSVYDMNAAISIWKRNVLLNNETLFTNKTGIYVMPDERSIDIDSDFDFLVVNYLLNRKTRKTT